MEKELLKFSDSFDGELYFDTIHRSMYATDASVYRKVPLAVAYPRSISAIKQLVHFSSEQKTSLIPRTAGTSLAGQCVGEGIIVDTSKYFTRIISLNTEERTVTVQPGVIRDELNTFLAPHGLFFGPNTSTSNRCMIGGMVGNNSSGTTSIRYGVTRDKVIQLKTILSNGDEATFETLSKSEFIEKTQLNTLEGKIYKMLLNELQPEIVREEIEREFPKPEIHRRNTGYAIDSLISTEVFSDSNSQINICSLLCGSEGTLAFTTEITLKLDELPPIYSAMVIGHYGSIDKCLLDVSIAMKHELYTCEMMDDVILNCTRHNKLYEPYSFFVKGYPKALLLLELKADTARELDQKIEALQISLSQSKHSYSSPVLHGKEIEMALELRKAGLGLLGNMVGDRKAVACIEDTSVTLDDLPVFIAEFTSLMASFNQEAVYYAHAGAGELHLRPILNLKKQEDVIFFRNITTAVARLTKKYKGSFSGEHGDGIVRSEFLPMLIGEKNYNLLKRIKFTFDPDSIFNPGKIVDANKMDESLRYEIDRIEPTIETKLDFKDSGGILRLAEKCNGSGDCRKTAKFSGVMCPSYQATKDEKNTTRARANVLREVLTNNKRANVFDSADLKEIFDLCLSCKGCASECPSNVDVASAKLEFLYNYYKSNDVSRSDRFFAMSSAYTKKASKFPILINALFANSFSSKLIKKLSGIHPKRSLQPIAKKSFSCKSKQKGLQTELQGKKILLFIDEFSNYLESEIAEDTYDLLTGLGYQVTIIDQLDSARAMLSKGFLDEAKSQIDMNISVISDLISDEVPLIGIEPSAILGFRDEYLRLAEDLVSAKKIEKNTFLIEEFLASEINKGAIRPEQFTSDEKAIKIHIHCHQKALSNQKVTFDLLNLPTNYHPTIIPSGCCGMAGSFGFERNHYELSMKIGELKLFPSIRNASETTLIAANGTSCRHQIKDGTDRNALHPITILKRALI